MRDAESSADTTGLRKVEKLALTALNEGSLVMIAYQSAAQAGHWVLGVGCGGMEHRHRTDLDTIYVLDTGDEAPTGLTVYNALLQRQISKSHGRKEWIMRYRDGSAIKATLISAIRFDAV